jgi:prepilin-type N-terminal cleavage/methylation domain-containing protein
MKHVNNSNRPRRSRSGFTLLELLMVIAIIGILASLLTSAVWVVFGKARVTQVATEITQLDQALVSFKSRFGIEPPSNLLIPAAGAPWDTKSRAAVRALWPTFNFSTNGGMANNGPIHLNGAECLVFFLGGMPNQITGTLSGFSKNPRTPWTFTAGNADGPFFEFDMGRLVDVDAGIDAVPFPEYVDPLPDQQTPYLYLTGQGKNYNKANAAASNITQLDDYDVFNDWTRDLAACYRTGNWDQPQRNDGFQIISPGQDGQYGMGGIYTDGQELFNKDLNGDSSIANVDSNTNLSYGDAVDFRELRDVEADNITNFSAGLMRP